MLALLETDQGVDKQTMLVMVVWKGGARTKGTPAPELTIADGKFVVKGR